MSDDCESYASADIGMEDEPAPSTALTAQRVKQQLKRHPGWVGAITDACTLIDQLQAENEALHEEATADLDRRLLDGCRISALEAENARLRTVTPAMLAAAWATWKPRHKDRLGPGPAFREAIEAAIAAAGAPVRGEEG